MNGPRVSAVVADRENVDMQIALELPEDIAKRLELAWRDVSRGTLEAVAVEGYRFGNPRLGCTPRVGGLGRCLKRLERTTFRMTPRLLRHIQEKLSP
jgi:hypothetical protein